MLEVDDEGGRMFLRVLLHLTMHDYPPLVSGALQLLFKHFSQRQEAVHTFKQVRRATSQPGAGPHGAPGVPGDLVAHNLTGMLSYALKCASFRGRGSSFSRLWHLLT